MDQYAIMENSSSIRKLGRGALRGKRKLALAAALVPFAVVVAPTVVLLPLLPGACASLAYCLLVFGPLELGYSAFALSLYDNKEPKIGQLFHGFAEYRKAMKLFAVRCFYICVWSLVAAPGIALAFIEPSFFPFVFLLSVPGAMAFVRYSQSFFILADNPEMGMRECISLSKAMMAENKAKYALLLLSLTRWLLLAVAAAVAAALSVAVSKAAELGIGSGTADSLWHAVLLGAKAAFGLVPLPVSLLAAAAAFAGCIALVAYMNASLAAFYRTALGKPRQRRPMS